MSPPEFRQTDSREVQIDAIARLPDPERMVMRLYVLGRKTTDQIAAELGLSVAETEHLLHEAARLLRKELASAPPPPPIAWEQ